MTTSPCCGIVTPTVAVDVRGDFARRGHLVAAS
jgi:hypothetical protein